MTVAAPPPPGARGVVSELKARLGPDSFSLLQAVSIRYQRGEASAAQYYELALDILGGDVASLLRLVSKLPDASKRDAVLHHHQAAQLEQQLLAEQAAAAAEDAQSNGQFLDEDDQGALSAAGGSGSASSDGGGGGDRRFSRHMLNADGQPLAAVIRRFQPPWEEAEAAGAAARRGGTYQQLAAARRRVGGSAAAGQAGEPVPTSTPWVRGEASRAPESAAGAAEAGLQRLALGPASCPPTAAPACGGRPPVIVWFRRDLRLADHPALHAAAASGRPVLPVFIWAPQEYGGWPPGGASRYWLHQSLASLDGELRRRYGARLRCFDASASSSAEVLWRLARDTGAAEVVWCRQYEPCCLVRDVGVELALTGRCPAAARQLLPYHPRPAPPPASRPPLPGLAVRTFNGSLLYEPWDAAPDEQEAGLVYGGYGSVGFFTSSCQRLGDPAEPLPPPERLAALPAGVGPPGCSIAALGLADLPSVGPQQAQRSGRPAGAVDWAAGIRSTWRFGEAGAAAALDSFLEEGLEHFDSRSDAKTIQSQRYEEQEEALPGSAPLGGRGRRAGPTAPPSERFRADRKFTARISPYMAWGELSPRQVYHAARRRHGPRRARTFLRRLAWRDLSYWMLWRFPWMPDEPLRPQYAAQRWDLWWRGGVELLSLRSRFRRWRPEDPRLLAWQRGQTGFPLVDAGMRELWATAYCPNYVRHIVAGFLVEYLNIDWRHGLLWFHDTLCDADVAINSMMWQNGGHSGCDQWNFVMHPVFAAKAADPEGDYVRRWCPELARLPVPFVHAPWEAPATVLAAAGVTLGRHYPRRIVTDLEAARRGSLEAVVAMRRGAAGRRYVLPDGHDALPLPDGRFARAITRVDYRQMAQQPITKQAAADLWDKGRRPLRDPMAVAMQETLRGSLGPGRAAGGRGLG